MAAQGAGLRCNLTKHLVDGDRQHLTTLSLLESLLYALTHLKPGNETEIFLGTVRTSLRQPGPSVA